MLLYDDELPLAVAHVTLHMALRDTFRHITKESVLDKVRLLHDIVPRLTDRPARIAVAALNPHASDGGLFGDEEKAWFCTGFIGNGMVGKSKYSLFSLETSPDASASEMIPRMSVKRSEAFGHSLENQ